MLECSWYRALGTTTTNLTRRDVSESWTRFHKEQRHGRRAVGDEKIKNKNDARTCSADAATSLIITPKGRKRENTYRPTTTKEFLRPLSGSTIFDGWPFLTRHTETVHVVGDKFYRWPIFVVLYISLGLSPPSRFHFRSLISSHSGYTQQTVLHWPLFGGRRYGSDEPLRTSAPYLPAFYGLRFPIQTHNLGPSLSLSLVSKGILQRWCAYISFEMSVDSQLSHTADALKIHSISFFFTPP